MNEEKNHSNLDSIDAEETTTSSEIEDMDPSKLRVRSLLGRRTTQAAKSIIRNRGRYMIPEVSAHSSKYLTYSGDSITYEAIREMNKDPVISFCNKVQSAIISSLPYSISCPDPMIQAVLSHHLEAQYAEIVESLCSALYNGFSFGQKIWHKKRVTFYETEKQEDGTIKYKIAYNGNIDAIRNVKFIDPCSSLTYYVNNRLEEIEYVEQIAGVRNIRVDRRDLLWMSDGDPFDKIFGLTRYYNIAVNWEITLILYKYLLADLDRNTSAPNIVRYPEGYTEIEEDGEKMKVSNLDIANEIGKNLPKSESISLPSTKDRDGKEFLWGVSPIENWSNRGTEALNKSISYIDRTKMLGMSIPPALIQQAGDKPASASEVEAAMELMMFIEESFVAKIERCICEDYLDDIVMMNFPRSNRVPYKFKIDKSVFNKRGIVRQVIELMIRANSQVLNGGKMIPNHMPDLKSILDQVNVPNTETMSMYTRNTWTENSEDDVSDDEEDEGLLDDKEKDEDSNDKNRIKKRTPRTKKEGVKKPIIPGAR